MIVTLAAGTGVALAPGLLTTGTEPGEIEAAGPGVVLALGLLAAAVAPRVGAPTTVGGAPPCVGSGFGSVPTSVIWVGVGPVAAAPGVAQPPLVATMAVTAAVVPTAPLPAATGTLVPATPLPVAAILEPLAVVEAAWLPAAAGVPLVALPVVDALPAVAAALRAALVAKALSTVGVALPPQALSTAARPAPPRPDRIARRDRID
ncbi:MAG: hypothetical protein ACR2JW_09605 [Thermomicrobiales bacterium]